MTILFRQQYTRQSTDSLTPYELIHKSLISTSYTPNIPNYLNYYYLINRTELPFISYTQIEAISWAEVLERKNELRADLRSQIEDIPESHLTGYGPEWNPFELISTNELVCATLEDFTKHFDMLYNHQHDSNMDFFKEHNISTNAALFNNDVRVEFFINRYL